MRHNRQRLIPWMVMAMTGLGLCPSAAFADGIDLPIFLAFGGGVLAVILTFEVLCEAAILRWLLEVPLWKAALFFLMANILSLLAGIPTMIVNSRLYAWLLPEDLSGYFHTYHRVALPTAHYFVVTVLVEG